MILEQDCKGQEVHIQPKGCQKHEAERRLQQSWEDKCCPDAGGLLCSCLEAYFPAPVSCTQRRSSGHAVGMCPTPLPTSTGTANKSDVCFSLGYPQSSHYLHDSGLSCFIRACILLKGSLLSLRLLSHTCSNFV